MYDIHTKWFDFVFRRVEKDWVCYIQFKTKSYFRGIEITSDYIVPYKIQRKEGR